MNLELGHPLADPTVKLPSTRSRPVRVLHIGKFYPPHMGSIETHLQARCGTLKDSVNIRVIGSSDDQHWLTQIV
jgi:hypothetical protein